MFGFGNSFAGFFGPTFQHEYRCFPVSAIGRDDLETGNRMVLPPSAVQELSRAQAPSPMLFEVTDLEQLFRTHAGVLEFTAPEETCYLPGWMLRRLHAAEGHVLRVALKALPKATFALLRPASVALLRVYNPRAMLENGLRGFAALTAGDEFQVPYNSQLYSVEVVEVRPGDAACIVDADVQVEFATPKDAQSAAQSLSDSVAKLEESVKADFPSEPAKKPPDAAEETARKGLELFGGTGARPDGAPVPARPEADETDSNGEMPWKSKRRIRGGVKNTTPPYGYDRAKVQGQSAADRAAAGLVSAAAMPAACEGAPTLGGTMSGQAASPGALKGQALEAAQRRENEQAEEIARRRALEEEERRRRAQEEEQKRLKAQELAEKARQAPQAPAQKAPAQKRMANGRAGAGEAHISSSPRADGDGGSGGFCCGCLRASGDSAGGRAPSAQV